jgi:hypothetical protein
MNRFFVGFLLVPALAGAPAVAQRPTAVPTLTLTSSAFEDGGIIPNKYTQNSSSPVSPPLQWTYVPRGTISFALVLDNMDTALKKTTTEDLQWMIFNIPGGSTSLPEAEPDQPQLPGGAVQGKNAHGIPGFLAPGAAVAGPYHHYLFQLYALDTNLSLGPDATRDDLLKAMDGHVLGKGVLEGRFHR